MIAPPEETSILEKNVRFFTTLYLFFKNIIKLFLLEFVLAKASFKRIIVYSVFLIFFGFSLWFMLLSVFVMLLHGWLGGWLLPLGIVTGANFLMVMIILLFIFSHAKNLSFRHTRKYLGNQ